MRSDEIERPPVSLPALADIDNEHAAAVRLAAKLDREACELERRSRHARQEHARAHALVEQLEAQRRDTILVGAR